jgi:tRNA(adenine34) deaminase
MQENNEPPRVVNVRRRTLLGALLTATPAIPVAGTSATEPAAERRWYEAAVGMRRLAESWGDQSYGAVLVLDSRLVGEGPSRVVRNSDPDAHAEREAIRDAQRRLGRTNLQGAVLYSTSRPCALCQQAAARARVSRMVFGAQLEDGGAP